MKRVIFIALVLLTFNLAHSDQRKPQANSDIQSIQCTLDDETVLAMGTFNPSGPTSEDGSTTGWLQLTVVTGGHTYLSSGQGKMIPGSKQNLYVSTTVDSKSKPYLRLSGEDKNNYITSGKTKVSIAAYCW